MNNEGIKAYLKHILVYQDEKTQSYTVIVDPELQVIRLFRDYNLLLIYVCLNVQKDFLQLDGFAFYHIWIHWNYNKSEKESSFLNVFRN